MAARKDPEDRVRRNKVDYVDPNAKQPIKLPPWDGRTRGPTLGPKNPQGFKWHRLTLRWWKTWRQSPQAMFMTDTDWESMFVAAVIHDTMMNGCSHTALAALSAQLTRREGMVGASIEDRIRLGMSTDTGRAEAEEATVQAGVRAAVNYVENVAKALEAQNGAP